MVDSGIGIHASLAQAYPNLADTEAIQRAVEEGATRDPSVGAGYGLAGCRRIVQINAGRMVVYSGRALFTQPTNLQAGGETLRHYVVASAPHPGTLVELQLRTDREVDLEKAVRTGVIPPLIELTQEKGGELTFDVDREAENLATRDAGRKLRHKVLNLTAQVPEDRVVLNFSAVEMLSSSFADEFVAKLATELGKERFWDRFEIRSMNRSVGAIVWGAISNRLGGRV